MTTEPVRPDSEVEALLEAAALPIADLRTAPGLHLFGVRADLRLVGVVGVEVHGAVGLLRSLAVGEKYRGEGRGRALVSHAESWAFRRGVEALYLLTTAAADFFARLGYAAISRSEAPAAIAGTSQFADLCPVSAVFMRKALTANISIKANAVAGPRR